MSQKIIRLIILLSVTYVVGSDQTVNDEDAYYPIDTVSYLGHSKVKAPKDGLTRETNIEIKQTYLECVNINSEVDKLTTTFTLNSSESCNTLYRYPSLQIPYEISFKNGSTAKMQIKVELQDSEPYPDKTIVTLTGKVMDGYLKDAHFQNVISYPPLNDPNVCSSEPGVTELRSNSASVTFILLPTIAEQTDSNLFRSFHLPEAFDCFGNTSAKYTPGLLQL